MGPPPEQTLLLATQLTKRFGAVTAVRDVSFRAHEGDFIAIFGVIAGFSYYVLTVRNNQRNQEISLRNQEQTLKTRHAAIYHQVVAPTLSLVGIKNFLIIEENPVSSYEEWVEAISLNPEWFVAWSWLCMQYARAKYFEEHPEL